MAGRPVFGIFTGGFPQTSRVLVPRTMRRRIQLLGLVPDNQISAFKLFVVFSTRNARNAMMRPSSPLNHPCVRSRTSKLYLSSSSMIPCHCFVVSYVIYYPQPGVCGCLPPRMLFPFPLQLRLLKQPGYLPLSIHLLLASALNRLICSLSLVARIPTSSR